MKGRVLWAGLSIAVVICTAVISVKLANANDEKAEPGPAKPPELQVLDRLVGTWEWEVTAKPAEWTPKETRTRGTLTREWVLKGRFVQEKGGDAENPTLGMWTYDFQKKGYRLWLFNADGSFSEHTGRWDEPYRTFSWQSDLGNGSTAAGKSVFTDKNADEWRMVAKDKEGKIYLDLVGKNRRKK